MSGTTANVTEATTLLPEPTTSVPEPATNEPEPTTNVSDAGTNPPEAAADETGAVADAPEAVSDETAEKTEYQHPVALPGFEEVTTAWWDAVIDVHEALLSDDAGLDRVSGAFNRELRARWDYARTLHEYGYLVPDYLAERAPIAPLWPLPDMPAVARRIVRAA